MEAEVQSTSTSASNKTQVEDITTSSEDSTDSAKNQPSVSVPQLITSMQQPSTTGEVKSSSQVQHEPSTQSISSSAAVTQGDLNANNGPGKPEETAKTPSSSSIISSISDTNDHSDNKTEPSSLQKFLQVLEEIFKYIWKVIKSIGKELNNHKFPIVVCGAIGGVIGFLVGAIPGIFIGIGVGAAIGYGISKCFCTTITKKIEDPKDPLATGEKLSAPLIQLITSTLESKVESK